MKDTKKLKLPDSPGVYFFRKGKAILYIGKATSLRDRVRSYFNGAIGDSRGPRIVQMLQLATAVDHQATDSVLEALLLETALIKKHQPKYNAREKDDKSFNFVVVTKEAWPRVLMVRGKNLADPKTAYQAVFGPFPKGGELKEAIKIIRKIFPFRDKCLPFEALAKEGLPHPCFNRQIGLCPGVCTGEISQKDYGKIVKNLILFFEGKKGQVVKNLETEMKSLAKAHEFERAAKIRNQLFSLQHIKDIALIKRREEASGDDFRIEAYDVAHTSGKNTVGVMTVVSGGEVAKAEYRKFKIKGAGRDQNNDLLNLTEVLERRFTHSDWPAPKLVVVDGGQTHLNSVIKLLSKWGLQIPVVSVVKDERHKARQILGDQALISKYQNAIILANSEAHRYAIGYHRQLRRVIV